jgi:uncharacterized small protein (DUF1192 family)
VTTRPAAARFSAILGQKLKARAMAAIDEDDKPKKKISHEIGQDLSLLSVEELAARVQLMRDEISRLEADMANKRASRSAADQFFKR